MAPAHTDRVRPRRTRLLLILLLVVVVNVPPLHAAWTDQRLDGGTTVPAAATPEGAPPGQLNVAMPREVTEALTPDESGDEGLLVLPARVDPATYDRAVASGELDVTYLPDDPAVYRVEGADNGIALTSILVINGGLLLLVALFLLVRGRSRPELRMVATADLRRVPPGALLERLHGNDYVVRGDIDQLADDELVLEVGDRRVRVLLDGYVNPAAYQQSVEVRGTMIG